MRKILITGATGKLGGHVIDALLQIVTTEQVIAAVKDWSKADELIMKGIEVRYANYDDPSALDAALQGIDRLLLISGTDAANRLVQHQNVIDAAQNNHVRFIAYTSVSMKEPSNSELAFLMNSHVATESYLRDSGISHAILRNTLYAEDLSYYTGKKEAIMLQGIHYPAGNGKIPFALRQEMSEAFAHLLLMKDPVPGIYEIGNSRSFSFREIAETLSGLTGTHILYHGEELERYAGSVRSLNLPKEIVSFLIHTSQDIRDGKYDIVTGDLERLLGRRPADLTEIIQKTLGL